MTDKVLLEPGYNIVNDSKFDHIKKYLQRVTELFGNEIQKLKRKH